MLKKEYCVLTFKIENSELENKFLEVAKNQKKAVEDVILDAMKYFINTQKEDKKDKLVYTKKDPLKHLHKIERDYDEDMCDDVALTHIEDSASYIHNLRRQKNR